MEENLPDCATIHRSHNLPPQSNAYLEKHILLLIRVSTTANSVAIFVATTLVVVVEPAFSAAVMSTVVILP